MALVFDIETDGLWPQVKTIWLLATEDTDTGEQKQYSNFDPSLPSLEEGLSSLHEAKILAGHNIAGYDLMVLEYLLEWKPRDNQIIYDTWVMSQLVSYKRGHRHGLDGWGGALSYPKLSFDDFSKYSKEMLTYCIRDVSLNVKVYKQLVEEIKLIAKVNPLIGKGLVVECEFARIEAEIRLKGWRFNHQKAKELLEEFSKRMVEIEEEINPLIGLVTVKVDKAEDYKEPAIKKDGTYSLKTCKWFDIPPENALEECLVGGPYCRIKSEQGKLSSDKVLKQWLYSIGWVPDDWNVEKINGKFVQKSPKLTKSSLELLGPIGEKISEYNSISNRHGVLKGWIQESEYDGRLHGRMWTIGTPTFRCRHEVIANLPSVLHKDNGEVLLGIDGGYGYEMRSLLLPDKGTILVGADSAGNQMRGLCHYIDNPEFTHEVINGDVHTRNANTLSEFTEGIPNRKRSKPFLYAFLFGAAGAKLGLILTGVKDKTVGDAAIKKFEDSIPGLKKLKTGIEEQWNRSKARFGEQNAFIRGIDGRMIFVSSKHQLLNYLLQTLEGITCKAAAVYFSKKAREEGIPFSFRLHYHDEMAVQVEPQYEERVKKLLVEAFTEAPKMFGVSCMSGSAQSGTNYADIH